ncbi:hypothetical protein LRR18_16960, partial [Mangrovimonas sp. AS39]|uniref:hypothetical protein n=1 Tax=Mangrovimonas futianensis TaxID=2895523 RepID=UPI001E3BF3F8
FESNDEESLLKQEIFLLKKEMTNTRKGLFSRHSDMMKLIVKQQEEIDKLKYMITSKKEIIDFTIHKKG